MDALVKFCNKSGWTPKIEASDSRTLLFQVPNERGAFEALDSFAGVHRVQRYSHKGDGRKMTATALVAVLKEQRQEKVVLRDEDLRVDRMRGSGSGGQRRNKVETAVRVTHLPTKTVVVRTSGRSQVANLEDAKRELMAKLQNSRDEISNKTASQQLANQIDADKRGKQFTHCWYRDEVVDHQTNRKWRVKDWSSGKM